MGETRVDLLHLLEDLRDAYPESVEETILIEMVANALDSGARQIQVVADAQAATLTVTDDGRGMRRRDLARYHDLATSTKTPGQGIGFAGVGIKLGLLISSEVFTETKRNDSHVATRWLLAARHKAPWRWVPPVGLVAEHGTAVRLHLQNPLSTILDATFLAAALRRHFASLFDPAFAALLAPFYPTGVCVAVNGELLAPAPEADGERAPLEVRLPRHRKPLAAGYIVRSPSALPDGESGLAICTLGKVIRRGWDWLGLSPANADCMTGLVEAPALAASLTLNKGDFIRTGARGAAFLSMRKALQEAVGRQLALWGNAPASVEHRRRAKRPIERDVAHVLAGLTADFPLLSSLLERRRETQHRLRLTGTAADAAVTDATLFVAPEPLEARTEATADGLTAALVVTDASSGEAPVPAGPPAAPPSAVAADHLADGDPTGGAHAAGGPAKAGVRTSRKSTRGKPRGLVIELESVPESLEMARLVESTIFVNTAHPTFERAASTRAEPYHVALATALALSPLATTADHEHEFVNAFMRGWGEAATDKPRRERGASRRGAVTRP
ncbi:MAG: ATP-binding protein [Deltaproteobacteria bacterium]|nr:ATP-binding protein [Deltaproteobacteria bacterium]